MDIFRRYAPFIQDFIYRERWQSLRAVQNAAGDVLFNSGDNLLLSAATASGKTEAAFFPILTLLSEEPSASVGVLYIAPLKALINDQFERLDRLCERADIRVTKWHGDASRSAKERLIKHPEGILQITPESLEALLLHRKAAVPTLFSDLRFVVIDEIHALLRQDRGRQTFCLIERLMRLSGCRPRRVGLSATIGNPKEVGRLLAAGSGHATAIPRMEPGKEHWRLSLEHFWKTGPQAGGGERTPGGTAPALTDTLPLDTPGEAAPRGADPGIGYIFSHSAGKKCLIFTNSREECELVCQELRQYCEAMREQDRFLIHHGNLSASYRESAEEEMQRADSLKSICATATLELGIDVGRLERAFQLDAPFTVSGFLQRLGRTGRRGAPAELWFVMREEPAEARASLPEAFPWYLLQGIALVQLYAEERYVEPPDTRRLPYSLLYHQTMSTLASEGELTPRELARRVLTLTPFERIRKEEYGLLLQHLLRIDHINRTAEGGLIVGIAGERVVNNHKFYAVFQENVEYTVRTGSETLGTIVKPPPAGEKIAIAGRVWAVDEVDHKAHTVLCTLIKGRVPAYFGDVAGSIETRILERMRKALLEEQIYPYLQRNAAGRLLEARTLAARTRLKKTALLPLGEKIWALFPWLGSYAFLALERFLKLRCKERLGLRGFTSARPYYMIFSMEVGEEEFFEILLDEAEKEFAPEELLYEREVPVFEKFDCYVPEELVRRGFARGVLDLETMLARVRGRFALQDCDRPAITG